MQRTEPSSGCRLLADLAQFFDCPQAIRPDPSVLVVTIGLQALRGPTAEYHWMAKIDVTERLPIVITGLKDDGTPGELGSPVEFDIEGDAGELIEEGGVHKILGVSQGSVTVTATVPRAGRGDPFTLVGLVVVNDPEDDATIAELNFGEPEPAAPAEPAT